MHKCFKVRVTDGPGCRWEAFLIVIYRQGTVQSLLVRISDLAVDEKDFLVYLSPC